MARNDDSSGGGRGDSEFAATDTTNDRVVVTTTTTTTPAPVPVPTITTVPAPPPSATTSPAPSTTTSPTGTTTTAPTTPAPTTTTTVEDPCAPYAVAPTSTCNEPDEVRPSCRALSFCGCEDSIYNYKQVFIELTSICNFDCIYCAYQFSKRPKKFMEMATLDKLIEDLKEFKVDYIMFSALGEPTLHPQFAEACRKLKAAGLHLTVTNNGSKLDKSMYDLPIDELFISLMSPTKESFWARGYETDYDEYLRNICEFAKDVPYKTTIYLLEENKRLYPQIEGLVTKENRIETLNRIGQIINPDFKVESIDRQYVWVSPNVVLYLRNLDPWLVISERPDFLECTDVPYCSYYKHHINVLNNGDVTFCCMDYEGFGVMGNINKESLMDIYKRKPVNIDLTRYEMCRKCKGDICP